MSENPGKSGPRGAVFLERRTYRRRRLRDAARLLPVLGILLWAVPVLWPIAPDGGVQSSNALIYIFGVWIGLVAVALAISLRLRPVPDDDGLEE